ncbi:MAG: hypothetical protein ACOCX0_01590 [Bacteroidota bacterium]
MKTRILVFTAMFMFVVGAAMAGVNNTDDVKIPTPAARLLEKKINAPYDANLKNENTYVAFELRVKENNSVEFFPISASNTRLSQNVEKQIKRLESSLTKVMKPGTAQRFKINFVKQ